MRITEVVADEVNDSRGNPTLEVTLRAGDTAASAKVPSGKSAGKREALELRDPDGHRVEKAIANVNQVIGPSLIGRELDATAVDGIIRELDGTENKSRLGANALLGVSFAALRLEANIEGVPLWRRISDIAGTEPRFPYLYMNMMNGGAHSDFKLPFQEYIVVIGGSGARASYEKAKRIFATLGASIEREFGNVPFGDEGGYAPDIASLRRPLELLTQAIENESGATLAIDAAASEFFHDDRYVLKGIPFVREELLDLYRSFVSEFALKSIEDPFDEDDLEGFKAITSLLGDRALIVGDDLTVTNPSIVRAIIEAKAANAMIVKPNQIGTMTEVFEVARLARSAGWEIVVSHRSGETDDSFVADLAYGLGAYGLKAGAPTQPERRAKYERLCAIEDEL